MKIEYICRFCLLIEVEDLRIAPDPWLDGATYCDKYNLPDLQAEFLPPN